MGEKVVRIDGDMKIIRIFAAQSAVNKQKGIWHR